MLEKKTHSISELSVNEAQKCAILHGSGAMLVLAGPGSGKTFVLTRRIQHLIEHNHISPEQILVITFTKKAAAEMKERAVKLTPAAENVFFGTFHSCFYQILLQTPKYHQMKPCTLQTQRQILTAVLYANHFDSDEIPNLFPKILKEISYVKNAGISIDSFGSRVVEPEQFRNIYQSYNRELHQQFSLDFDDMLLLCYAYLRQNPQEKEKWQERFRYILIDEFQDINAVQYAVIKQLTGPERNVFVVGDDDQAIYGFRGSNPGFMQRFQQEFTPCRQVLLNVNYRCRKDIVGLSLKSIGSNENRFAKEIIAHNQEAGGVMIKQYTTQEKECEAIVIQLKEILQEKKSAAILYRTNKGAGIWAEALFRADIPFTQEEKLKDFYEEEVVKDVLAYFSFCFERPTRFSFFQCMNKPVRYINRSAIATEMVDLEALLNFYSNHVKMQETIRTLFADFEFMRRCDPYSALLYLEKKMGYLDYLQTKYGMGTEKAKEAEEVLAELKSRLKAFQQVPQFLQFVRAYQNTLQNSDKAEKEKPEKDSVKLMTYHASKGLEFDAVFLPGLNKGVVPHPRAISKEAIEEERRMFYVAMTRAKKELYLSYICDTKQKEESQSTFLMELEL